MTDNTPEPKNKPIAPAERDAAIHAAAERILDIAGFDFSAFVDDHEKRDVMRAQVEPLVKRTVEGVFEIRAKIDELDVTLVGDSQLFRTYGNDMDVVFADARKELQALLKGAVNVADQLRGHNEIGSFGFAANDTMKAFREEIGNITGEQFQSPERSWHK
jgi:2C-methyl-D-erythritol 2,4-cyclodiphosphate synthase